VTLITRECFTSQDLLCGSWEEALTAAGEIMNDYSDAVLIELIDPRGWPHELTKPMFRM